VDNRRLLAASIGDDEEMGNILEVGASIIFLRWISATYELYTHIVSPCTQPIDLPETHQIQTNLQGQIMGPTSQLLRPQPRGLPPPHVLVIDRQGAYQYREREKVEQGVCRWLASGEEVGRVSWEGCLFGVSRGPVGGTSGGRVGRRRGCMNGKDRRGISVAVVTLGQHVTHPRELNVSSIPIASSARPHSLPLILLLPLQVLRILRGILLNQINPAH
jgi:hypothetical protein